MLCNDLAGVLECERSELREYKQSNLEVEESKINLLELNLIIIFNLLTFHLPTFQLPVVRAWKPNRQEWNDLSIIVRG